MDVTATDVGYALDGDAEVCADLAAVLRGAPYQAVTPTGPWAASADDDLAVLAALSLVRPSDFRVTGAAPMFPSVPGRLY